MLAPTLHPTSFVSPRAMSDTEDCERPTAAPISCCVMPHPIRSVTSSFHFIGNIIGSPITKVNRKTDIKPREHTRMKKETNPQTFGQHIKEARRDAKMTQTQLARRVKMSQPNLSELENDEYPSSYFTPAPGLEGFFSSNRLRQIGDMRVRLLP